MRHYYFIFSYTFLVLCFSITSWAQTPYHPFPEDSAQWSYREAGYDSSLGYNVIRTYQLKMRGDTILNGISYNKIYRSNILSYFSPDDTLWCFLRQDTSIKKVFVKYPYFRFNDSTEILLYDFSLQTGDTFSFKFITDGSLHYALIDTILDSLQTFTDFRRLFQTSILYDSLWGWPWGGGCDGGCGWIEGVGNGCNLLYIEIPWYHCMAYSLNLQCFWEKGEYILGGNFCDFISTQVFQLNSEPPIYLSYDPNSQKIKINTKNQFEVNSFIIFNILGEIICNSTESKTDINVSKYDDGCYIVKVISTLGTEYHLKFIISK